MTAQSPAVVWLAAVAIVAVGYVGIIQRSEHLIHEQLEAARVIEARITSGDRRLAEQVELRDARARITRDVRELVGSDDTPRFLKAVSSSAREFGITAVNVLPASIDEPDAAFPRDLRWREMTLGMRGRFGNTLQFLTDLARHDRLIEIRSVALSERSSATDQHLLDINVETRLYHVNSNGVAREQ